MTCFPLVTEQNNDGAGPAHLTVTSICTIFPCVHITWTSTSAANSLKPILWLVTGRSGQTGSVNGRVTGSQSCPLLPSMASWGHSSTQQNDWVSPKMSMDRSGKGGLRDNYGYANNFTKPSYTNLYKAMMNPWGLFHFGFVRIYYKIPILSKLNPQMSL